MKTKIITFQSPGGRSIGLCKECARIRSENGNWPTDDRGQEYCTVSMGLHFGTCDIHAAINEAMEVAV